MASLQDLVTRLKKLKDKTTLDERAGSALRSGVKRTANFLDRSVVGAPGRFVQNVGNDLQKSYFNSISQGRSAFQNYGTQRQQGNSKFKAITSPEVRNPAFNSVASYAKMGAFPIAAANPLSTLAMSGIGGLASKATGGSFNQGAAGSFANSGLVNTYGKLTSPVISKVINKIPVKKLPVRASRVIADRLAPATGNVIQGIGLDRSLGQQTNAASVGLDLVTGLVGGKSQFSGARPNAKGMTNKAKTVHPEDAAAIDAVLDTLRNKKLSPDDRKKAITTLDRLATHYLPKDQIDKLRGSQKSLSAKDLRVAKEIQKMSMGVQPDYDNGYVLGLAAKDNTSMPLRVSGNSGANTAQTSKQTLQMRPQTKTDIRIKLNNSETSLIPLNNNTPDFVEYPRRSQLSGQQLGLTNQQLREYEATGKISKPQDARTKFNPTDEELDRASGEAAFASLNSPQKFWNMAQGLPDKVRSSFEELVNTRRALDTSAEVQRRKFTDLDNKGTDGFREIQAGSKSPFSQKLRQYFDTKYKEVRDTDFDLNYRKDYLPQLWDNTKEEIEQAFKKKLGQRPAFSFQAVIDDYDTGIRLGLKPKFTKVSDLVSWYEKNANRTIANRKFFNTLLDNNYIVRSDNAPKDWVSLDPDSFPTVKTLMDDGTYSGTYKAPAEIARVVNNYFKSDDGILGSIANFTSTVKNRILVGGVPKTGINAHGFNMMARSMLANKNPITGGLQTGAWLVRPNSAAKYVSENLEEAEQFAKAGMSFNIEDYQDRRPILESSNRIAQALGKLDDKYDEWFGDPLFNNVIPAVKIKYAKDLMTDLIKGGMDTSQARKQAANAANEMFGGINTEQIARSKDFQNLMRSIILAADWAETTVRLGVKTAKSVTTQARNPAFKQYRTFARNMVASYIAYNTLNKAISGKWLWENEAGQELAIDTGQFDENGKKIYFRPYGTAADMFRLPFEVAKGLASGDSSTVMRTISNRINPVPATGIRLITNQDWMGRPLAGKDNYGNEIPLKEGLVNQGTEIATGLLGVPNFAKAPIEYATGKAGMGEAISSALELPLRFKGGAYSKKDKEKVANLKLSGASNQEIGQAIAKEPAQSSSFLDKITGKAEASTAKPPESNIPSDQATFTEVYKQALSKGTGFRDKVQEIKYDPSLSEAEKQEKIQKLRTDMLPYAEQLIAMEDKHPEMVFEAEIENYASGNGEVVEDRGAWVKEQLEKVGTDETKKQELIDRLWDEKVLTSGSKGVAQYLLDTYGINVYGYKGTNKNGKNAGKGGGKGKKGKKLNVKASGLTKVDIPSAQLSKISFARGSNPLPKVRIQMPQKAPQIKSSELLRIAQVKPKKATFNKIKISKS